MAVDAGRAPLAAPLAPIPLHRRIYGLGSIYGKTLRDSRLAFIIMTGLIGGMMLAIGSAWSTAYGTIEARREIVLLVESVPPILAGIAGPIVKPDTMGGFLTYKYGPFFAFLAGLWSILALSGTLAGEARRGSLDFVAAAPFGKRRIALEKLAAHVTAMTASMAILALVCLRRRNVFGIASLGDQIAATSAIGFALWVGLIALVFGAVAFALAPVVGRGSAAGVAGRRALRGLHHRRLRARTCRSSRASPTSRGSTGRTTTSRSPASTTGPRWGSSRSTTVALYAVGVELFARRDLGVMTGLPVPGLPRATLGLRRAGRPRLRRPAAAGARRGASASASSASSWQPSAAPSRTACSTRSRPSREIISAVFPGVDLASTGWFLQLVFVEMGLIVVGFSAATFVGKWASDEESGRLEVLLAAPLTRRRWTLAGGIARTRRRRRDDGRLRHRHRLRLDLRGQRDRDADDGHHRPGPLRGGHGRGRLRHRRHLVGTDWAAELVAALVVLTFLIGLVAPALQAPGLGPAARADHAPRPAHGRRVGSCRHRACLVSRSAGMLLGAWGMSSAGRRRLDAVASGGRLRRSRLAGARAPA